MMKARIHKKYFLLLIFFLVPFLYLSAINYSGLNLSNDNRLLFKADFEGQQAVFLSRLTNMSIQQLTAFPEKMYLVENGQTIITLNRFGAARIPVAGGLPTPLAGYPSFSTGSLPLKGRLQDIAASADGRWFLHIEATSPGYGNLLLIDTSTGVRRTVSERVELPETNFPAKWSPDSRLFVYEKDSKLFFFPILTDLSVLIDERFRLIGPGTVSSVLWGQRGDFYYLTGNTLYHVISPELFTRTIYGDFLSIGNVVAVLPFDFEPGFDKYWVSPDSSSILINKGSRGLFYFLLGENRNTTNVVSALPHISIPFGAENFTVLWPASGPITAIYSHQNKITVQRFDTSGSTVNTLTNLTSPSSPNGAVSPDGNRAVFWGENGLELWDYTNWRLIQKLNDNQVFSCVWVNPRQIIIGTAEVIEEINVSQSNFPRRRISISAADEFGFEESARGQPEILVRVGTNWFATDGVRAWTSADNVQLRQVSLASDRFRVFLEPRGIMIRNMQATGTLSLMSGHTSNRVFSQVRPMQIALCFSLYDDATGLPQVLAALARHNIKATFFLNGEFIRRNPQAAAAIAEAGHEAASLFYAPIDLSDTRFRITREFIAQGLARNEDEFNRATGKELSPLWHPPFFRTSNAINSAAAAAGYTTVARVLDTGDWVSREDSLRLNLRQIPPAEMVEQIINRKRAGAVIPIRLGLLSGGRDEYLFQRIEVLLDALIRTGSTIVPVSEVIRY